MKLQRKIVLGALAASVVISVVLTVVFATQPKVVETVFASSSSEIKEQEFFNASYTEEDFMEGDDLFASENQSGNASKNSTSTPALSGGKVTVLNNPKGWNDNSDKSKRNRI